ncbi:MAG: OmpA-like transrane protein, partial [Rhodospirillales bacterium]|nr:OmpA-like transrane protein [Rhodospirillales bacterium]
MQAAFRGSRRSLGVAALAFAVFASGGARAQWGTPSSPHTPENAAVGNPNTGSQDTAQVRDWSLHGQMTGVYQGDFGFRSPYRGPNSLSGDEQWRETISATAYLGRRLWQGGELYFNPEFNQGFGLSHSLGIASFSSGEAQKAGFDTPKPNVARLFLRQTFGLGGATEAVEDDLNQIAGPVDVDRIVVTAGKFSIVDIFDDNQYAHDARTQFLNVALEDSVAYDYPADAKGYTDGVAVELNRKTWALRGGWFLEPKIANTRNLEPRFWKRFGSVAELETRHELWGAPGKLRFLVFANRAPMANLRQALAFARLNGTVPDFAPVRRDRWKAGVAFNFEQAVTDDLGVFSRLSWNDGKTEGWAFTDIDAGVSAGISLKGTSWGRKADTVGFGSAANFLSSAHQAFFAAGGTGIFVGDGRLNYSPET